MRRRYLVCVRAQRAGARGGGERTPLDTALTVMSVALLAAAAVLAIPYLTQGASYRALAEEADVQAGTGIDWDALLAQNPDTAAWLAVEGTGIDYPVVKPGPNKAGDWYLHHDFQGRKSPMGCPYLDPRSEADGRHALVYGHHLGLSGQMFSSVYDTYRQERFERVGAARWSTPAGGTLKLRPAMAMSVDKGYAPIQEFGFETVDELRTWLRRLSDDAQASAPELDALVGRARRVLTLVTCSSPIGGQRARTLLVFVA